MSEQERDFESGRLRIDPDTGQPYETTSWASVDLEPFKRGERVIPPPRYLKRDDGQALIYPGKPHVFYGESESLKSWGALLACRSVLEDGGRVIYVDMEGSEPSFVERCRIVGIAEAAIGGDLRFVRPTGPLNHDAQVDLWHYELDMFEPSLVVLDGVTELYALQGWDINSGTDAARFQKTFAFHRGGVASIGIDHTAKDAGRGQLGSQHKRAGLDGAEYEFVAKQRGGRGGVSVSEVRVTKDRHGFIREWAEDVVGRLVVGTAPGSGAQVKLVSTGFDELGRDGERELERRQQIRAAITKLLKKHPGVSTAFVKTNVTGHRNITVGEELAAMEEDGLVVGTPHGQAMTWSQP